MTLQPIRFDSLPVSAWRNGAGRKADIASSADWHVGFAWLDADAPFSDFTGHDRTITLIDGPGFSLDFAGHPPLHVTAPYRPAAFDGGWAAQCKLRGGPSLVLNAMTARAQYRHSVTIQAVDTTVELGDAEAMFLVLLLGTATVADGVTLGARDAVRVDTPLPLRLSPGARACTIAIYGEG